MLFVVLFVVSACVQDSDTVQREQQEIMLKEATNSVGMPAIKNFRERRIMKEILELRDQKGLVTYTYTFNQYTGKLRFFGETIGYGIPYATQYTNPMKPKNHDLALPQADPTGLFSPGSAEGTWILMKDPNSDKVTPVYIEPRIVVSTFKLPDRLLEKD
jgi:hypothetical protein